VTDYRIVSRHVRYWRGAIHKWSTVWPFTGTLTSGNYAAAIAATKTVEDATNYNKTAQVGGGIYEIALYDQAVGGVPVAVTTYFPWATPSSWIAYSAINWSARTFPLNPNAEAALQVEWAAGLSTSGKPVHFRKWFHSVPDESPTPGSPDFVAGDITGLSAGLVTYSNAMSALGAPMGRGGRLAAVTPNVRNFAGNHQMPRGRRRIALPAAASTIPLPPGLLIVPGSDGSVP
jgi:hypothetical protein